MTVLDVTNLCKTYSGRRHKAGVIAVHKVSFTVDRGKTLAIVGESGAGKSTTGLLVLRLIEPDSGQIRLQGIDVQALGTRELRKARCHMQMIFQDPHSSLDPRIPIGQSVAEPLLVLQGMNRADREKRASALLERVAVGRHLYNRYPHELSGGQLQRVAIARALTVEPALIVCDEPVSALDVSVRAQVLNLLLELQSERNLSYLFISHDLSVVETMADDVMVMAKGNVMEAGTRQQIFHDPQHPYTRELLAAIPIADPFQRGQFEGRRGTDSAGDVTLAVAK